MEKHMSERIDTKGRVKKKFKEQDRDFVGLGCDNIEMDRTVRNVMSYLAGLKKLVKDLSDRFDEYEESKVFEDKRALEKELVNERNGKEFTENTVNICVECCKIIKSPKIVFLCLLVRKDAAFAVAAIATSGIDDDDDDTAPMDSQPYEPRGSPRSYYCESVEAAIRAERERVQNEANRTGGPNVASVAQECTFADFMKCIPITFRGNEGAVATMEIEAVTRKTKAEIKVMMTEEFCPPEEIQRIEGQKARDCWSKVVATDANVQPIVTCYACGEKGHIKTNCPDVVFFVGNKEWSQSSFHVMGRHLNTVTLAHGGQENLGRQKTASILPAANEINKMHQRYMDPQQKERHKIMRELCVAGLFGFRLGTMITRCNQVQLASKSAIISQVFVESLIPPQLMVGTSQLIISNETTTTSLTCFSSEAYLLYRLQRGAVTTLPNPNDCRPPDSLVYNIHPGPYAQILGVEYNPKVKAPNEKDQERRRNRNHGTPTSKGKTKGDRILADSGTEQLDFIALTQKIGNPKY
nr:mannosyl-oligosaccharide 1,2-alpha-mannosidase [Tanacetum cinerariifolium]